KKNLIYTLPFTRGGYRNEKSRNIPSVRSEARVCRRKNIIYTHLYNEGIKRIFLQEIESKEQ
ncbi:MAG: hypothetical protein ACI4AB_03005, partial [Acetatifactor sp.]